METGTQAPRWRELSRETMLSEYKEISDYGLIGDQKTCALVGIDGSIDWVCFPRFDSPSIFAALLDIKKGGSFKIMPVAETFSSYQHYDGNTNVLITEFKTSTGHVTVTDFMPCFKVEKSLVTSGEIHRRIRRVKGSMDLEVLLDPRFKYGALTPSVERAKNAGYTFLSAEKESRQEVALLTDLEFIERNAGTISCLVDEKDLDLVLRYGGIRAHHKNEAFTGIKLVETTRYWKEWASKCIYSGRWKDEVVRSALTLKLLVYAPTGAIIAAPTTSLPEEIGGVRNWDYRYSWIRDSSFVLWAFHSLGYVEEALTYLDWILSMFYLSACNLQVLVGIAGDRNISEFTLDHLEGYRGSAPVRVGNAAWGQFQLDVYGILLDALYFGHKHGGKIYRKVYNYMIKQIMNSLIEDWRKPDCGIWEVRGDMKQFVYSKVWCWVAADRARRIAKSLSIEDDEEKWRELADEIRSDIMKNGWNDSLNTFVRSYGSEEIDSANLLMPQVKFLDSSDPKMVATIDATMKKLMMGDGYIYRYLAEDGLPGKEGTFLICSFWLVKCLALSSRVEEAKKLMDSLVSRANHLGLFSEEIDPESNAMRGNFPQAFTHMGFITAAISLDKALDGQQGAKMNMHDQSRATKVDPV
ncbi:MAG: glycoside hydrolase family 15 protein [Nitrososphaerales archaeon]